MANEKGAAPKSRDELIADATKIRDEIDQIFTDAKHWNENVRKPHETPIDPDPDGTLAKIRDQLNRALVTEKTIQKVGGPPGAVVVAILGAIAALLVSCGRPDAKPASAPPPAPSPTAQVELPKTVTMTQHDFEEIKRLATEIRDGADQLAEQRRIQREREEAAEAAKAAEQLRPLRPDPTLMVNPFKTAEEHELEARKRGFVLVDEQGKEWLRIARQDGDDINRGLFPSTAIAEFSVEPVVEHRDGKWRVTAARKEGDQK